MSKGRVIDLTRCKCCNKRPRGKMNLASFERYRPFCSYHCQETFKLREALNYCASRSREAAQ